MKDTDSASQPLSNLDAFRSAVSTWHQLILHAPPMPDWYEVDPEHYLGPKPKTPLPDDPSFNLHQVEEYKDRGVVPGVSPEVLEKVKRFSRAWDRAMKDRAIYSFRAKMVRHARWPIFYANSVSSLLIREENNPDSDVNQMFQRLADHVGYDMDQLHGPKTSPPTDPN